MKRHILSLLGLILLTCSCIDRQEDGFLYIESDLYKEKVYASWLGQIVGNSYGLSYEFAYVDQPGPDSFPYGYGRMLDTLRKYDGAFSDDDTDIEYMYLTQMEKWGVEPSYFHLAEAWKKHVKSKVWCANRAALTLMNAGHFPPVTGKQGYNTQWMQIDPQLVNEIWAVTAPGMLDYAVRKSAFAARITNDSFGIEPTLFYGAMYSAAFFEENIDSLIKIGLKKLPQNAAFIEVVNTVKSLYESYPEDWEKAREIVKGKYLVNGEHNKYAWPPIDAHLNGALGVMALLYGQGDFQKTLDYSCAFGMDADNQAATMCGLLGIINGIKAIPHDLLYPIENSAWKDPFNDKYKMITREGLEDGSLKDMAGRMAIMGEKVILQNGGSIEYAEGKKYYKIKPDVAFIPPFELNPIPALISEKGESIDYPVYTGRENVKFSFEDQASLQCEIKKDELLIHCDKTGKFSFELIAESQNEHRKIQVDVQVFEENLAPLADQIVFNQNAIDKNIELIRDGNIENSYYSIKEKDSREIDYYGYVWEKEQIISNLIFNNGLPAEYCGWFTSFDVEYLENDQWKKLRSYDISPELNLENTQWLKGHFMDYLISFDSIKTKGIRIKGLSGGIPKDPGNAHLGMQYYTSISELKVY